MKDYKKGFRVGDLVINTYIGAVLRGKVGIVVGFDHLGDVVVRYGNQDHRLTGKCLEVISEAG
jgi:hypothetical protein